MNRRRNKKSRLLSWEPFSFTETRGQFLRFLVIGSTTVLIDLACYRALLWSGLETDLAKGISFIAGTVFAYFANRNWTFRATGSVVVFIKFIVIYAATLAVNVLVNKISLAFLGHSETGLIIAFVLATGVSAGLNFLGMKFIVFRVRAE